jgi:hypothetical protein
MVRTQQMAPQYLFPMIQFRKMAEERLSFEQQQLILKWYWKYVIVHEVQSLWTRVIETARPEPTTL